MGWVLVMAIKELWESPGVVCQKCGAKNPSEARFCIKCGAKLSVEVSQDVSSFLLSLAFIVAIISFLDLLFNSGVASLVKANQIFSGFFLLGLLSFIIIAYVWFRFKDVGFPKNGTIYKLFISALVLLSVVYLAYYITFFLANIIAISPLWILYLWLLYMVIKKQ